MKSGTLFWRLGRAMSHNKVGNFSFQSMPVLGAFQSNELLLFACCGKSTSL